MKRSVRLMKLHLAVEPLDIAWYYYLLVYIFSAFFWTAAAALYVCVCEQHKKEIKLIGNA